MVAQCMDGPLTRRRIFAAILATSCGVSTAPLQDDDATSTPGQPTSDSAVQDVDTDPGENVVPPVTAEPGTALHHAQLCQQYLGVVPSWSCKDGVQIPILVDGVEVFEDQPVQSCDNPDLGGKCNVGAYIGRVEGSNFNGTPRPEVVWATLCRRDVGPSLNSAPAQMIGYDTLTGATCFFELEFGLVPIADGIPDGELPGPDDPAYEDHWRSPAEVAMQGCHECHTPDPFIHTPYLNAARLPSDPSQPVVPEIAHPTNPYFMVGEDYAFWEMRYVKFEDNECTTCHRIPDFTKYTTWSLANYNDHMPPHAPGTMTDDYLEVMACLEGGPNNTEGCAWAVLE